MYVVVALNACRNLVFHMTYITHHYTVNGFIMVWTSRNKYHSSKTGSIYKVYGGHLKKWRPFFQMPFQIMY